MYHCDKTSARDSFLSPCDNRGQPFIKSIPDVSNDFFYQLARRAGVPDGVINAVTTQKNVIEVGKEMCESKIVKKVSFTGSTPIAKLLTGMAAKTLKKYEYMAV